MQTRKLGGGNIFSQEVGIYSHKRQPAQYRRIFIYCKLQIRRCGYILIRNNLHKLRNIHIMQDYTHEFDVESLGENMFTNLLEEGLCLRVCVQDEFIFPKPIWHHGAMFVCH